MRWPSSRLSVPDAPGTVRLNLGCGTDYREGWINVDWNPTGSLRVDRSFNVEDIPWPLETASVDYVLMSHVAEHVRHGLLYGVTRKLLRIIDEGLRAGRIDERHAREAEALAAKDGLISVMEEVHRILRPAGILDVVSPGPWTPDAWLDPTHARAVEGDFWTYFVKDTLPTRSFYTSSRFEFVRQEWLRTLDFRAPFRWVRFRDYHAQQYLGVAVTPLRRLGVKRWHYTRLRREAASKVTGTA